MTTDAGSALPRAILDEPEDDTHRLAYADWLEGEVDTAESRARAEFIRVQVAFHHSRCVLAAYKTDPYLLYCNCQDCRHCALARTMGRHLCQPGSWLGRFASSGLISPWLRPLRHLHGCRLARSRRRHHRLPSCAGGDADDVA